MLGFASGVMIAASFWSLLAPAIDMAEEMGGFGWMEAAVGFLLGGAFCGASTKFCPICILDTRWKRPKGIQDELAAQCAAGVGDHTA
jgi:zinc transporter, ZIP family